MAVIKSLGSMRFLIGHNVRNRGQERIERVCGRKREIRKIAEKDKEWKRKMVIEKERRMRKTDRRDREENEKERR